jgi:hypothetical protein
MVNVANRMGLATGVICVFLIGNLPPYVFIALFATFKALVGCGSLPDCASVTPELQLTFRADPLAVRSETCWVRVSSDSGTVKPYNPITL